MAPTWRPGEKVQWKDCTGAFRRALDDGEHAEVAIGERGSENCGKPALPRLSRARRMRDTIEAFGVATREEGAR